MTNNTSIRFGSLGQPCLKTLALSLALGSFGVLASAQTVYEAESSSNSLSGSAVAGRCSPCSGGYNVQYLGGPGNGVVQFNNISIPSSGTYQVSVTYDNGVSIDLPASVSANGGSAQTVHFAPTNSWDNLATVSVSLPLKAGNNSIKFASANGNYVAEIDKISLPVNSSSNQPPPPTQPPPSNQNNVLLTSFGSAGQGGDDTGVFQSALNNTAANRVTLEIPRASNTYNVGPLTIPSNSTIVVDSGVTIQARSGFSSSERLLNITGVSNVSITGTPGSSIFQMRKSEYTSGESRHCLDIEGANSVTISGIECNSSGGDGLYIGAGDQGYSNNISVYNSSFDNNRRQGFSLTSGSNITIDGCTFSNTSGTAPQNGIDLEPNGTSDRLQNINIKNTTSTGNAGDGLMFSFWATGPSAQAVSITVSNLTASNNRLHGIFAENEHDNGSGGPGGNILIQNSSSSNNGGFGAVASYWDVPGPMLTFQNLSVSNANQSGGNEDGAAIGVRRGGGDGSSMGNVTFTGTSISDTTHKLSTYFMVEDYSNVGIRNVHINSFGSLSGAPSGAPVGILSGSGVSSVNIQ